MPVVAAMQFANPSDAKLHFANGAWTVTRRPIVVLFHSKRQRRSSALRRLEKLSECG